MIYPDTLTCRYTQMLDAFFTPRSVAVIGASREPTKLGFTLVNNLVQCGYPGRILPINPKAGEILGLKAYPSVLAVPDEIDLAVIVIPYPLVPAALRECGQKHVPAVVIISAGFREAGREGVEREAELIQIAREYGIRLIGPNCLGVIDTFMPLNATFAAGTPPRGPIAFMSQSGALGTAILDWALADSGISFSRFASLGNKADVSEIDLLEAWADDPHSRVILVYTEGLTDGQKFIEVARRVSRIKPVVAVKSGVTQAGTRAVSSHTGSLAGSEQAYHAAFQQAGVLRADSMQALFDYALAFAHQPPLAGDRIAIVTNAGGPGILATDALERAGLELARFEPETIRALEEFLPDAASAANPVDVLGDARADRYEFALRHVLADPNVDGVLVILTPQAMTEIEATAEVVARLAASQTEAAQSEASARPARPVLACFMGEARVRAGITILNQHGIPNYPFPERAAAAFQAMSRYRAVQAEPPPEFERLDSDRAAVERVLAQAWAAGRVSLGDAEARAIIVACGLRVPEARLAATADEAVAAAEALGYPVVLKIASPDILHKTDIGGVKLNLATASDVRDAFELIIYRATRYMPDAEIWGCQVQRMAPPGLEVIVGMNRDPQFGPLVTFGLGGIYVETLRDVTFRIAPFSRRDAEAMLGEIRAHALLEGVRGRPQADTAAIVDALLRISQLVTDFPQILELDINPLVVYEKGRGALALDARLVLAS